MIFMPFHPDFPVSAALQSFFGLKHQKQRSEHQCFPVVFISKLKDQLDINHTNFHFRNNAWPHMAREPG